MCSLHRSILADKTSRNLFFFLCLNLSFAFVELLYGIWSNRYRGGRRGAGGRRGGSGSRRAGSGASRRGQCHVCLGAAGPALPARRLEGPAPGGGGCGRAPRPAALSGPGPAARGVGRRKAGRQAAGKRCPAGRGPRRLAEEEAWGWWPFGACRWPWTRGLGRWLHLDVGSWVAKPSATLSVLPFE